MTGVLDHGYIKLIDHMGDDEAIVESARMSTDGSFRGWGPVCDECAPSGFKKDPKKMVLENCIECGRMGTLKALSVWQGDETFIKFLWVNRHTSPFEVAAATFEMKLPIMVVREWHRHRTQSYNEVSARYTALPNDNYAPTLTRLMLNANTSNRQANKADGVPDLTETEANKWLSMLSDSYDYAESVYQYGLSVGVPKELARLPVPVGRYTKMRASANLLNWLRFLGLRMHGRAQWEIRMYALMVCQELSKVFPRTMAAFDAANV